MNEPPFAAETTMAPVAPQAHPPAGGGVPAAGTQVAAWEVPGLEVRACVGQGRSGIEYLASDTVTRHECTLKEYLPPQLAQRRGESVDLLSPAAAAQFEAGLRAFVDEARWLMHMRHASLRRVLHVWRAHGTALATLERPAGVTLWRHLERLPPEQRIPEEDWLVALLRALAGALQAMHNAARLHRGLNPGEVLIAERGPAQLLGLGTMQLRHPDGTPVFADAVRDGFAAPEQYRHAAAPPQGGPDGPGPPAATDERSSSPDTTGLAATLAPAEGPWTDLYALAAIAYGLMTGVALEPAPLRAKGLAADPGTRLAQLPPTRFNARLVQGVERTLSLSPAQRPRSVSEFLSVTGLAPPRPRAPIDLARILPTAPPVPAPREPLAPPVAAAPSMVEVFASPQSPAAAPRKPRRRAAAAMQSQPR